jgi:multicomponent Na+:H+ antiporter subunit E
VKTRTWPVFGVVLVALWLLVSGPAPQLDAIVGQLLFGVLVGFPVAFLFRRFYADDYDLDRGIAAIPYAVLYVLVFLKEVVVANVDVAYRAVAPGPPLDPEVIYVPLRVETDLGVTTIANSITITPGTVTLDYDEEYNGLYVHVIDGRNVEDVVEPIRTWEDYALVIFDEELEPGDRPERVTITGGDRSDR